ncbi:MAG: ATP-binding protein, partial [Gammaproteobacteria bacterium]|nr:ATP-binding protein [Gammaproteobacteria bacterium]
MSNQALTAQLLTVHTPITEMTPIDFSLATSLQAQLPSTLKKLKFRFYRVKEIPEEKSGQYRLAMANVLSGLQKPDQSMVYVLSGNRQGIALYLGVASDTTDVDICDEADSLASAFEGNFLGAQLEEDKDNKKFSQLTLGKHLGFISGVPSFNEDDTAAGGEDVQGIERLVNSLLGETWQLVIVAQAIAPDVVRQQINQLYELSTDLSQHIKLSVQQSENKGWNLSKTEGKSDSITVGDSRNETRGRSSGISETKGSSSSTQKSSSSTEKNSSKATNDGTSESIATGTSNSNTQGNNNSETVGRSGGDSTTLSRERMNKQIESLHQYINDTLLGRYYLGQTKGFFKTAIYVSADTKAVYDRLSNGVLSLFQGNQVSMVPMQVHKLASIPSTSITELLYFREIDAPKQLGFWQENALLQGMPVQPIQQKIMAATAITTRELTLIAGMPSIELPGLKIRKSVDFVR